MPYLPPNIHTKTTIITYKSANLSTDISANLSTDISANLSANISPIN